MWVHRLGRRFGDLGEGEEMRKAVPQPVATGPQPSGENAAP